MWRYWDGSQWTEHRHPGLPGAPPRDRASTVLLVVSYAGALLLPIVGFILGIVLLVRRQTAHGLAVVLISVAVTILAWQFLDDVEELNQSRQQDRSRKRTIWAKASSGTRALSPVAWRTTTTASLRAATCSSLRPTTAPTDYKPAACSSALLLSTARRSRVAAIHKWGRAL